LLWKVQLRQVVAIAWRRSEPPAAWLLWKVRLMAVTGAAHRK
jgi:hypothetical protein